MRLIGVDVDDCIIPDMTSKYWMEWCMEEFCTWADKIEDFQSKHPYSLWGEPSLEFWRSETLYDNIHPDPYSKEVLEKLSQYFGIVFISKQKGFHQKSKSYMLKKHYPYLEGIILTHEKHLMNNSVVAMIDDSRLMLEGFDPDKRVMKLNDFNRNTNLSCQMKFEDWKDFSVKDFCSNYL